MTTQEQHERRARAHDALRSELILALTNDPLAEVNAPAFHAAGGRLTAAQVIADQVHGCWDDAALAEAIRIVGMCARGAGGAELQARASAWIAGRATEHADFHAATMAAGMATEGAT